MRLFRIIINAMIAKTLGMDAFVILNVNRRNTKTTAMCVRIVMKRVKKEGPALVQETTRDPEAVMTVTSSWLMQLKRML